MRITHVHPYVEGDYMRQSRMPVTLDGLQEALTRDHGSYGELCRETSCDIGAMVRMGSVISAARMLQGATECENVDNVIRALAFNGENIGSHIYDAPDWQAWEAWHREHGRQCPACESYNYPEDEDYPPDACGNCRADLRVTLEHCVCGECFHCPDGFHSSREHPCSCTPDCLIGDDGPCPECDLHSLVTEHGEVTCKACDYDTEQAPSR